MHESQTANEQSSMNQHSSILSSNLTKEDKDYARKLRTRHLISALFEWFCFCCTWTGVLLLILLMTCVVYQCWGWLDWQFITSTNSSNPKKAGVLISLLGTLWLMFFTSLFAIPIGVGAAIYLEEFSSDNWFNRIIRINISNLAGIPSIVYGILGLTVFVECLYLFDAPGHAVVYQKEFHRVIPLGITTFHLRLPFGKSLISGALTLGILVLPIIIIASQEALRAVPRSIRHAAYALGATKWQAVWYQVLPASLPGIMTGIILAISRAIGETAPLIVVGVASFYAFAPGEIYGPVDAVKNLNAVGTTKGLMNVPYSTYMSIPYDIYNWVKRPERDFQHVAAAGIIVLLVMLFTLNLIAIYIRQRFERKLKW
jgi:phosphate transport system permease protein